MKYKITFLTLIFLLIGFYSFAQEEEEEEIHEYEIYESYVLAGANAGDGFGFFVQMEQYQPFNIEGNRSIYFRAAAIFDVNVNRLFEEYKGTGYSLALGSRTYYSKHSGYGFFSGNELKYQSVNFDDTNYKGTYSYFSLFAPELGWKFLLGQSRKFGIEISGGVEWAIEVKGKGDVDNIIFDNWKPKAALGFIYAF